MAGEIDIGYGSPNRGVAAFADGSPISLYFDIPEGKHADLEVVARAAIEWVAIIREIASIVAPELDIEIELVETEDGSLWLSGLLRAIKEGDRKALASITWAVLIFFVMGPVLHIQTDTGNKFWEALGHKDFAELSDKDKDDIANRVVEKLEHTVAGDRRNKMIREVEKDPNIKGVGVDRIPKKGAPAVIIKRDDFPFYAPELTTEKPRRLKDTNYRNRVRVKVLRANLKEEEKNPRWRFKEGDGEWSADIEDEEFVDALNHDRTGLSLAVGQIMVVNIAIDVLWVEGAWEEANRRITRVTEPIVERRQGDLYSGAE